MSDPNRRTGRALVIGVAKPLWGDGAFAELDGVPIDVAGMAQMLAGRGYEVTVPSGPGALRTAELQASLVELVAATRPGEEGLIYLTGHGFQVPDTSGDEDWDEAFVTENGLIPDDWFRDTLWPLAQDGSRFIVIVDACHSESLTSYVIEPQEAPPAVIRAVPAGRYRLTLSACPDAKEALDGAPKVGSQVTSELLRALRTAPHANYRDLWRDVANAVPTSDRIGRPQISSRGPDDALVDSVAFSLDLTEAASLDRSSSSLAELLLNSSPAIGRVEPV